MFLILKRFLFITVVLFLAGCTYRPYQYSFALIDPYVEDLKFEDKDVSFQFIPTAEYIWVSIYNKTEGSIHFDVDKAEYIDLLGESHTVLFGWRYGLQIKAFVNNYLYIDPVRIDPKSASDGNIWINIWPGIGGGIGDDRTSIKDTDIEYMIQGMLPEYSFQGNGAEFKDSTFFLILPIQFDSYTKNYEFIFMITDVEIVERKKGQKIANQ
ncbi:MAG: hypothetical protein H8D23_34475 [Candidatus Brocadiales bacterium]|nr:hypothetical protein [Candidatus Brocadiales bacterium]